jgi:RimJ/RimL family protein N-acetyltransferase
MPWVIENAKNRGGSYDGMRSDPAPTLITPRLYLRPLRPADARPFATILRDPQVGRMLPRRVRREGGQSFVDRVLREQRAGSCYTFAIAPKGHRIAIGEVRLFRWNRDDRNAEIGIWIGRRWWGQGLGPEAIRAVCAFGFGTMRLHRIVAEALTENRRSIRALEGCGFRLEGRMRHAVLLNRRWCDLSILATLDPHAR